MRVDQGMVWKAAAAAQAGSGRKSHGLVMAGVVVMVVMVVVRRRVVVGVWVRVVVVVVRVGVVSVGDDRRCVVRLHRHRVGVMVAGRRGVVLLLLEMVLSATAAGRPAEKAVVDPMLRWDGRRRDTGVRKTECLKKH